MNMIISSDFEGGNIIVERIDGDDIYLERDLRDSSPDWFYWAFCIKGAQGRTLTFHFRRDRLGYYGPAVSHNFSRWYWYGECDKESAYFKYSFTEDEKKVYFAHNILYDTKRFYKLCDKYAVQIRELGKSRAGRSIPYIIYGDGDDVLLLTSRHHACEATGSYVLEGVLAELFEYGIEGFKLICVPFVDFDGVTDGDQGKNRLPHDHNRDYDPKQKPVYETTGWIRDIIKKEKIRMAFDFHSPYHLGGENDRSYIVLKNGRVYDEQIRFSEVLSQNIKYGAFPYHISGTYPADTGWNLSSIQDFAGYVINNSSCDVALSFEMPYFGAPYAVTQDNMILLGRSFGDTIKKYYAQRKG